MKKLYILLALVALCWIGLPAQVVTTQPTVVQTDSHDIIITFHADRGNKGLMGVGKNTKVYAHTGVITNKSTSSSDWKYAPKWGDNSPKYELTWVSANTWTLTIPDINTYLRRTRRRDCQTACLRIPYGRQLERRQSRRRKRHICKRTARRFPARADQRSAL